MAMRITDETLMGTFEQKRELVRSFTMFDDDFFAVVMVDKAAAQGVLRVLAGIEDRVGSLAPGLDADLVLFDADPLTLEARPALVMVNGQIIHKKFTE